MKINKITTRCYDKTPSDNKKSLTGLMRNISEDWKQDGTGKR